MFITVFWKNTKRKVKSFNNVHRIVIQKDNLTVYSLTAKSENFDLSLFVFYILG